MNSDNDVAIVRRFGALNMRNLLYMQAELAEVETKILAYDDRQRQQPGGNNGKRVHDTEPEREALMKEVRSILKEYNETLETLSSIRQLTRPPKKHVESLRNWLRAPDNAIMPRNDLSFMDTHHEHDLVSIVPRERNLLERCVEDYSDFISRWPFKRNQEQIAAHINVSPEMQYFSEKKSTTLG